MRIEVRNTHWKNQGAQLMLRAVVDQLGRDHTVVVSDRGAISKTRQELSLERLVWVQALGPLASSVEHLLPSRAWEILGRVPSRKVDAVLDASGFAYGDSWGVSKARMTLPYVKRLKRRGAKFIMLPQALGPFTTEPLKQMMTEIFALADLVFARDPTSLASARALMGETNRLRQSADFTIGLTAQPDQRPLPERAVAFVPNTKMLQHANQSQHYLPLLVRVAKALSDKGLQPVVVVHSAEDGALAQQFAASVGGSPPVIHEAHPLRLKGLLSRCEVVVSSRFHGLVNSLAAGVPSLATSWSHKYQHLLEDFNCTEGMLPLDISDSDLAKAVNQFGDDSQRNELRQRILGSKRQLLAQSERMWDAVRAQLDRSA